MLCFQSIQGGMGLDHPHPRSLHSRVHPLPDRVPPKRRALGPESQ